MKLFLPLLLGLLGTGGGIGAAVFMGGGESPAEDGCAPVEGAADDAFASLIPKPPEPEGDFVDFPKQFLVPVLKGKAVEAMVILSLGLEVVPGTEEEIFAKEPKLRDLFLEELFSHATLGGFDVGFTEGTSLRELKRDLTAIASDATQGNIRNVLITEIARQEK